MNVGDTFYLRGPENPRPHLWVILSDPIIDPERVLFVNFTTETPNSDKSCIIGPDEHPCLSHASCVNYPKARVYSNQELDDAKKGGALDIQKPMPPNVLRRIQVGAAVSDEISNKHRQMLIEQGLCSD